MTLAQVLEAPKIGRLCADGTFIRACTEGMIPEVVAFLRKMHAESAAHRDMSLNTGKLGQQLLAALQYSHLVFLRVAIRGDEIIGVFFGLLETPFFSNDIIARDLLWFVRKDKRGSVFGIRLLREFERWAKENGASKIMLGQSTGVRIDETRKLYERLGYEVVGVNTVKEI